MTAQSPSTDQNPRRSVFVVGASGGVGSRLVPLLHRQGHDVTGMCRSEEAAAAVEDAGGTPVRGDLVEDSAETLAEKMAGHDAVVFLAGGGGKPGAVDRDGAEKAADAAGAAGVHRFVLVSVFMDAWRGEESPGQGFEDYTSAKRAADVHLAATDLDWLIVRPGTLVDTAGTGLVTAGVAVTYGEIPRDDVAAFIASAAFAPGLDRVAVEITGGSTPVERAVSALRPRQAS